MKFEVNMDFSFPHAFLEKGRHTFLMPTSPEVERLIGMIVSCWGAFELRMNLLIWEFAKAMRELLDINWERQEFIRRKRKFKEFSSKYCRLNFPSYESKLVRVADLSGDLHWKRNVIAHGLYNFKVDCSGGGRKSAARLLLLGS